MANGSIATKTADYTLVSMAPDVCWTKVGKSWRPIPYNITHTMDNSENVSPNVFAGGKEAFMHGESFITGVTGDEPGRRGGIVTGTLTEISFGLEKSGSVYVNGKPSVRTGDQVWMNQTTPAAKQGKVGPDKPTSWVKVVATYDDPWKTPIHEAPLILSINGQCVAPMSTLSGGTGHNTTVSSQAMAIQTQEEPGTLVQVGVDPGSVQVVGDTIPGLEDVNRELRFSLESSLDTTYRRVLTSMQEFQAQWDEYGIFSTAISYKDGALAGSELWFDHLADTKKLITETDWLGLSETAYEKVTAGLETAVGSIEDSHKKAANWLIEGAQQEKPWAWFGNQITDASEYAWNTYTNTVEDVADDIADLFKETKEDLESIADISVKLFEHRDDIFLFFQNISSANTSDIANFIDTVIADIDPELARSIKEDTDSYGVFLELINDDAGRIFLSYLGLIIGAVPPNFYAFLYGAAAAYIILEVLFCILLAFISGGLAVAARFAAIIARIAVMGMKVTAVNKRIASGARAVSAYIDSLKVIESSLKQLKAIGANTRRIKLKGQKASGSTGETLVIERKVVPNNFPLSQSQIDEIRNTPHGQRPDPSKYLSSGYIDEHLSNFDDGASRFMSQKNLDKYGIAQRDGTSFVMTRSQADQLLASSNGDPKAMANALGLPEDLFESNTLMRVDIPNPKELNLRVPSGNEAGANDFWIPGGRLPDGALEAVIDAGNISSDRYVQTPLLF
ncbi:DUF4150 domain-containing protein [Neptunomonas sp.]|uniref:DUF4150 domain-containing protein n=1 Tax=Neptunomonas TaxID=75687 RepID=UPI0035195FC7